MENKYYICKKCGNIIEMVRPSGVPVFCCGEKMEELIPASVDAAQEKHVPVYEINGNKIMVSVGEINHPMQEEHFIEWIAIKTKQGMQRKKLNPGDEPKACFTLCEEDEIEEVFAYCNLHGFWKNK